MLVVPNASAITSVKDAFINLASAASSFKEERPTVLGLGKFCSRLKKGKPSKSELPSIKDLYRAQIPDAMQTT